MKFIQGQSREQINLFPVSLDQSIGPDNEVRIIDLFVDSLSIKDYGFRTDFTENGRPAYHPSDLLKLFIYGYLNKVRSSRDLEKECRRNIEVMWFLKCIKPDHNTISNFRRDNPIAIKKVFRTTVQIARHFDLIGGILIAGDSTKLRAQNSKKNNFNQAKIDRHDSVIIFKQYRTPACKSCKSHSACTRSKNGRLIHRTTITQYSARNRKKFYHRQRLYKRRQSIVEHPYGTLKRQWGFSYILTKKGISRASSDVGFMFIAYNLRRIGNILTRDRLKEYLRILVLMFLSKKDYPGLIKSLLRLSFFRVPVWAVKCEGVLVPA
jgi:transposase